MADFERQGASLWEAIANGSPELSDNPEGAEHLADRFEGQYLPAMMKARTPEAQERVWLAFWTYLTAPLTQRKPFRLSSKAADQLIGDVQKAMSQGLGQDP